MDNNLLNLMEEAQEVAEYLKALAHETRLVMVCLLGDGEMSVAEFTKYLGSTQSNVSQHLAKLRDRGVLETRRAGNQVFYRVKDRGTLDLIEVLQRTFCIESASRLKRI